MWLGKTAHTIFNKFIFKADLCEHLSQEQTGFSVPTSSNNYVNMATKLLRCRVVVMNDWGVPRALIERAQAA